MRLIAVRPHVLLACACLVSTVPIARPAAAQATLQLPSTAEQPAGPLGLTPDATQKVEPGAGLSERPMLLGGMGGVRPALDAYGLSIAATEIDELLGNASGGIRRGVAFEGLSAVTLTLDTGRLLGIPDGVLVATGYQIHGRGLSADALSNLSTVSSIEANRATRLFELWYEQSLPGRVSIRIGQQSVDQEFLISQYGQLFINSQFGWPTLPGVDLPSGGNAYPLGTLGVRVKKVAAHGVTILAALYDGSPLPIADADGRADRDGLRFGLDDGVFAIAELQIPHDAGAGAGAGAARLPGSVRFGAYFNSNRFADQGVDASGHWLADPASDGVARSHRGDWAVYAVVDQQIWRPADRPDGGIGLFARMVGAPGDRNPVAFFADGGVSWKGMTNSRPDDTLGFGIGTSLLSRDLRALNRFAARLDGHADATPAAETVLELTYQVQIAPWLQIQPDLQYVVCPAASSLQDGRRGIRPGNEWVLGIRTMVQF